jgi:tetratricopeptide (TPR) repeat protein
MSFTQRALARSALGDSVGAIEDCSKAIELSSDLGLAYAVRANARLKLSSGRNVDGARMDCEKALGLNPRIALAWYCKGLIAKKAGDFDPALREFTKAIECDPDLGAAILERADVRLIRREYDEAISDATRVLELEPDSAGAFNIRACANEYRHDFGPAMADFDRAIAIEPENARYFCNRGRLKRLMGQYRAAIADFDAALSLSPHAPLPYVGRALTHRFLGDVAGARDDLLKAIEFAPSEDVAILRVQAWELLALAGHTAAAAHELVAAQSAEGTPAWTQSIVAYLSGSVTQDQFLHDADTREREVDATYYIGVHHLVESRRDAAAEWFKKCVAIGDAGHEEYDLARWHLELNSRQPVAVERAGDVD